MRETMQERVQGYASRHRSRKVFRKVIRVMGCAVAFVTTYALILPAITMEKNVFCGFEEHTHNETCYQRQIEYREKICNVGADLHTHTADCYQTDGSVICGQADYVIHTHDDSCRNMEGELLCPLPERSAHTHTEECYVTPEPIRHIHTDACLVDVRGELICTQQASQGHKHTESCYLISSELLCTEVAEHHHEESCFVPELDCTESSEPHTHSDSCYSTGAQICNIPENHIHQGDCMESNLACGKTEIFHTHDSGCYDSRLACTEDHTHSDGCWQNSLICGLSENDHQHTDGCYNSRTVCPLQENHIHNRSCYEATIICGKQDGEVHNHLESCYSSRKQLICPLDENHIHGNTCYHQELTCQIPESDGHEHGDTCYQWNQEYGCGMEEGQAEPAEPVLDCREPIASSHVHSSVCFRSQMMNAEPICGETHEHTYNCYSLSCSLTEHTHSAQCYSDPAADVETRQYWESILNKVELTDDLHTNVVAIAESQLGYPESTRNYTVWEDGSIHGYTRYGAWYGAPYGDWCGMFASFCLEYAGVEGMPYDYGVRPWIEKLSAPHLDLYRSAGAHTPSPGELVFFDWDQDKLSDHVGIVYEVIQPQENETGQLKTIEGNSSDRVQCVTYDLNDPVILGYSMLPEDPAQMQQEEPVYHCGMEAHGHSDVCFDAGGCLICQLPDHRHEDSCLTESVEVSVYYCGLDEHDHEEACYDGDNLICQMDCHRHEETCLAEPQTEPVYHCSLQEHTHGDGCYDDAYELVCQMEEHCHGAPCLTEECQLVYMTMYAQIYTDSTYETLSADDMQIIVTGMLPEDAKICAYPIAVDATLRVLCAYEIEIFRPDGAVYEPAEDESLNVVFKSNFLEEKEDVQVFYIPDEGDPEAVEATVTEDGITFEAPHFSVYAVMTTSEETLEPFTDGVLSYSWNMMKDAFIYDPQYASFYNSGSPLGTAGSFHIVGFDTVTLNSHTNGNILARNLIALNNFGTNSKNNVDLVEISYVQNYQQVNANSAADIGDYLVIGSDNTVAKTNNGYSLAINGIKMDKPNNIIQDVDTEEAPFISLSRVEAEINAISSNLHRYSSSGEDVLRAVTTGSDPYLELVSPDDVGIYNLTSSQLMAIQGNDGWDMRGFAREGNGAIVINVDCSQADRSQPLKLPKSRVYVDGKLVPLEETLDFSAGKVIWNFVNASGLRIETTEMTGMVLAPGATVNIGSNLNGTVVAENVNVNAESHRTDFAGRVIPTDHIDGAHIHVYKVDKDNYGQFLPGAKFILYEWNGASWTVAKQNSQDQIAISDAEGKLIFQNLTYNVAYRLEETQAPPGYMISTDYQYYYFDHPDTRRYPVRKPADFATTDADDCIIHYYPNEASDVDVTSLHLEKRWQDLQGNDLHVTPWNSVEVEITKGVSKAVTDSSGNLLMDANGQIVYEDAVTVSVMDTVTVYAADGWTKTLTNLPVTSDDRKEKYTYSAREVGTNYVQSPDDNGIVTIINRANVTYVPLSLQKKWEDGTPDDISEATFQLYRMFRRGDQGPWSEPELVLDQIVLNGSNGWTWNAEEHTLIKEMHYGEDAIQFAYFVIETPVPEGYYPDYHLITQQTPLIPEEQENILEVTNNKIQYTKLRIRKLWQDYYGNPLLEVPENSVFVQVKQTADGGNTWMDYGEPIEIKKQDAWEYILWDLPLEDAQGHTLAYRVEELPLLGYLPSGGTVGEDGNVEIINRRVQTTSLQIQKLWKEADGSSMELPPVEQIQVQILRSVNNGPFVPYKEPVTVKAQENWQLVIDGLPLTDPVLQETYRYTVQELKISDLYESNVSEVINGAVIITNTRKIEATDILVEKHWQNRNGTEFYANSGWVDVRLIQLYKSADSQGGASTRMVDVTVKLTRYGNDDSLFAGSSYSVPEGTVITVTMYTQGSQPPQLHEADPATPWQLQEIACTSAVRDGGVLTHTYVYTATSDILLVGKTNHWTMDECGGHSSYTSAGPEKEIYETVRLNVANGWKHLFANLPVHTYDGLGNITGSYFYYVEELNADQYRVSYLDPSNGTVSADRPAAGGTILVYNRLFEDSYVLPKTGGPGSMLYTGLGLVCVSVAVTLLGYNKKHRKGKKNSQNL